MDNYPFVWKLGSEQIKVTNSKNYLGIDITSNMKCPGAVEKTFGTTNLKQDFNPLTYVKLYKKTVLPSALYCCELWNNLTVSDMSSLQRMQHYS